MNTFADKLKTAREANNLTQEELAVLCGVSAATLSHYESGQRTPNLKNLVKIMRVIKLELK